MTRTYSEVGPIVLFSHDHIGIRVDHCFTAFANAEVAKLLQEHAGSEDAHILSYCRIVSLKQAINSLIQDEKPSLLSSPTPNLELWMFQLTTASFTWHIA